MKAKANNTEIKQQKLFMGMGYFSVVAVNPTNAEKAKIFGKDSIDGDEPTYTEEKDGVWQTRLEIWLKSDKVAHTNEKGEPINFTPRLTIWLRDKEVVNKDNTKKQVVDIFGNAYYADLETIEKHEMPYYISKKEENMGQKVPYLMDKDYHVAHEGEVAVMNLLICQMNVKSVLEKKGDKYVITSDQGRRNDSNVAIETPWGEVCKGNISEIKEALMLNPNNVFQVLCGIKTTEEGSQYPDTFNREFWKASDDKACKKATKSVTDLKNIGSYPNTEFDFARLHEYKVNPTNLENTNEVEEATTSPWDNQ